MTIAVLATVFGPVGMGGIPWIIIADGHRRPPSASMPRSRADDADARAGRPHAQPGGPGRLPGGLRQLHRTPPGVPAGAEKTIHEVEIYVGILIGAVTFSGSLIAFGKLGKIGGKPLLLPRATGSTCWG